LTQQGVFGVGKILLGQRKHLLKCLPYHCPGHA